MIDSNGHARLADFGLLTIVSDSTNSTTTSSSSSAGTTRWMSPELFDPEKFGLKDNRRTRESDCYALAMVILEVLTGRVPFPQYDAFVVVRKVVNGDRPERPQGPGAMWFTNDLWEMQERCWSSDPKLRPAIRVVHGCLERSSVGWRPLSPSTDGDFQLDSDDDSFSTLSHFSCTFLHFYLNPHSPAKPTLASQTIPQEGDEFSASPPGSPHHVNTDQSLSEPPLVSQRQPDGPLVSAVSRRIFFGRYRLSGCLSPIEVAPIRQWFGWPQRCSISDRRHLQKHTRTSATEPIRVQPVAPKVSDDAARTAFYLGWSVSLFLYTKSPIQCYFPSPVKFDNPQWDGPLLLENEKNAASDLLQFLESTRGYYPENVRRVFTVDPRSYEHRLLLGHTASRVDDALVFRQH